MNDESSFFLDTFQEVVTKLKQKEKELEHDHRIERERAEITELFSEKIISSIESALLTVDTRGRITTFNCAAERLFNLPAALAKTIDYKTLFSNSPQLTGLIENCLNSNLSYSRQEIELANHSNNKLTLGAAISPIKGSNGTSTGALCLITDLTAITDLQRRIKLKENLASLGEMSAGMAHEFKNSLATILGHAQIASRNAKMPVVSENLAAIVAEARSLLDVVASFLDFAKPSTLNLEEIDLGDLIAECIKAVVSIPNFFDVQLHVEGTFPKVKGDKVLLRQAFLNLLRNAFEAIPTQAREKQIWIRGSLETISNGQSMRIEVEDTGVGLPEGDLEKIFLPFYTTKREGHGLGLAITQKIIVLHYGKITAQRRKGNGTIFTVSLTAASADEII